MMGDNNSLIGCFIDSLITFKAYRLCLSFSRGTAGVKAASLTSGPIGVIFKAPVIDLACLFISR
jgi:hypothetical protein